MAGATEKVSGVVVQGGGGDEKASDREPQEEWAWRDKALIKALTCFQMNISGIRLFLPSTCNLCAPPQRVPVAEKNDSSTKSAVSDHHCSSAQMSHSDTPYVAIQKSINNIAESGTPVTYFSQTVDASNSAISETAKTIRKCVWHCAESDQASSAAGERLIECNLNSSCASKFAPGGEGHQANRSPSKPQT